MFKRREGASMPLIMIKCVRTGQVVATGMVIDRDAWIRLPADWEGDRFLCAACDTVHAWIKRDAFLDFTRERALRQ